MMTAEQERIDELAAAQAKAEDLFGEIQARGLIQPGMTEEELNAQIYDLAKEMFGITTYWHKRIVRAGSNTMLPYAENPPNRTIGEDDILFLDFGPVFEEWEADFGRTYVIGNDAAKHKLRADVELAFAKGKEYFRQNPDVTARDLYQYVAAMAKEFGWEFNAAMAGHLIGHFPHERISEDKVSLYVHPGNDLAIRSRSDDGLIRHWILEIHFIDRERQIGAFFEELLTI